MRPSLPTLVPELGLHGAVRVDVPAASRRSSRARGEPHWLLDTPRRETIRRRQDANAPPRATGLACYSTFKPIHFLPPARQQPAARRPAADVRVEVLERQAHRARAGLHAQRRARRDHRDRDHVLGAELGLGDVDQLVALALVELRQFGDREREQVAGAGDHHHPVLLDAADRGRLDHLRVRRQRQHRLAGLVAAGEVLEAGDEAVAVARHQHEAGVVVAAGERLERRARRRREAPGQRLAVAARRRQRRARSSNSCGRWSRGTPPAACCAPSPTPQQAVAVAVAERGRVDVVALGRAHPALLAEHHGHRLARHQLGFATAPAPRRARPAASGARRRTSSRRPAVRP